MLDQPEVIQASVVGGVVVAAGHMAVTVEGHPTVPNQHSTEVLATSASTREMCPALKTVLTHVTATPHWTDLDIYLMWVAVAHGHMGLPDRTEPHLLVETTAQETIPVGHPP